MRVVLAGGGTTGHIAPMLATAEAMTVSDPDVDITCVGTPRGLESTVVPAAGFPLEFVDPVPLSRTFNLNLFTLPFRVVKAVRQARKILTAAHADVVVGFGGYASLPVFLAARSMKVPVVVHEANAVPGLANRIASRFAAYTCVTFSNTGLPNQIVTGMPVRSMIADLDRPGLRAKARTDFDLPNDARVLLVSGGSQGAKALNDAVVAALPALDEGGVSVLHVTGKKNFSDLDDAPPLVHSTYRRLAYVDRMDEAYAAADLMLARSGSSTVTETAIVGLPTIFVPLPHGNGEQAKNAESLIAAGAGVLIDNADLTPQRLTSEVIELISDDEQLQRMGKAAQDLMPRDSARIVAQYAFDAARGENHASH